MTASFTSSLKSKQAGYSLVETMLALGISGIVFAGVSTVVVQAAKQRAWMEQESEKETLREMMRNRLACDLPCAESAVRMRGKYGRFVVAASCRGLSAGDLTATLLEQKDATSVEIEPLFDVGDGAPCRPRRAVSCGSFCASQTTLLERGFQFPPLDMAPTSVIGCPEGTRLIGVDFATARAVCEEHSVRRPATSGPYCRSQWADQVKASEGREVVIAGKIPCAEYTQYTGVQIAVSTTKLNVTLANDFVPSAGDRFVVVLASLGVTGRLAVPGEGERLELRDGKGSFAVSYYSRGIVLSGFRPAPSFQPVVTVQRPPAVAH